MLKNKQTILILVLTILVFSTLSYQTVSADANISDESKSPNGLTGDVFPATEVTFSCRFVPHREFPDLCWVEWVRLYYRVNDGTWSYKTMIHQIGTMWAWSGDAADFGAEALDEIDYYFKGKDSGDHFDQSSTYTYHLIDDIPPDVGTPSYYPSNPTEDDPLYYNATITDNDDVSSTHIRDIRQTQMGVSTLFWWSSASMVEGSNNVWWYNYTFGRGVGQHYCFTDGIDDTGNYGFSDDFATKELSDMWDFNEDLEDFTLERGTSWLRHEDFTNEISSGKIVFPNYTNKSAYVSINIDNINIDTADYRWVLIRAKTDASFDMNLYSINDTSGCICGDQVIPINYNPIFTEGFNSSSGWVEIKARIYTTGTESELTFTFAPDDYPNQSTNGEAIYIDYIAMIDTVEYTVGEGGGGGESLRPILPAIPAETDSLFTPSIVGISPSHQFCSVKDGVICLTKR